MLDEGIQTTNILYPVEIDVPWGELDASASGLKSSSSDAASAMSGIGSSWGGLVQAYRQPESQQAVWSAMDTVPGVVEDWADAMGSAAVALQDFVDEGRGLQQKSEGLKAQAALLQIKLAVSSIDLSLPFSGGEETGADAALRAQIGEHNAEVLNLNQEWSSLEERIAGDLSALESRGGVTEDVPLAYAPGAGMPGMPAGGFSPEFPLGEIVSAAAPSGSSSSEVEEAEKRYEEAMAEDASGEDVQAFLEHFEEMEAEDIKEFAENNQEANLQNLPAPASEEDLQAWPDGAWGVAWWSNSLDNKQREAMQNHLPLIVGNVRGVPSDVSHEANINALDHLRDSDEHAEYRDNIVDIERAVGEQDNAGDRYLLSLDVGTPGEDRQPLAEISVGDPDRAAEVTYNVPGMNSGTHSMDGEVDHAQTIYDNTGDQAVIAWMGYDPPTMDETTSFDEGSVLLDNRADEGGYRLAYALDSRHESRASEHSDGDSDVDIKVLAHSYGTNMTAHALTRTEHDVHSVVFMGSSGIPRDVAEDASDLNVEVVNGQPRVFATEANADWLAGVGRGDLPWWLGGGDFDPYGAMDRIDPTHEDFGAYVFTSDIHDPLFGESEHPDLESVTDHSRDMAEEGEYGYLDDGTLSLDTITQILRGENQLVDYESVPGYSIENYE